MPAPATPQPRLRHAATTLLLLLPPLATALACHHLRPRHDAFAWDSLQLLHALAPSPTQPCHHHHHTPFFPDNLLRNNHPHHHHATALRILQHLFHTLSTPNTPPHWDAHAHRRLLNALQHHIHQLQQCLADDATLSQDQAPRNLMLRLNKYFRDIQHFLRTHNHTACAWDHVLLEARVSLQHLHNLTHTNNN
ncbi:interferon-like [Opisthocomus hoazin]|uniref:interferon-like n=1 Tax=Opisthocomus hoazin TaxID=30419 RepID=UPI003F53B53F